MNKWKSIPGFTGYEVTAFGDVRSVDRTTKHRAGARRSIKGRRLKIGRDRDGYPRVGLCVDGRSRTIRVHVLVMLTFGTPKPDHPCEVNHKNGNKLDNHVDNLEWQSRKGNMEHAALLGLRPRGEKNGRAKLSEDDIREIRSLIARKTPKKHIARRFSVSPPVIEKIRTGKNWSHVS